MAWTVTFALLGALVFAIFVAPVMASMVFSKGAKEWQNPIMLWLTEHYRAAVRAAIVHRNITFGIATVLFAHRRLSHLRRTHRLGVSASPRRRLHLGARNAASQRRPHRQHRLHQQGAHGDGLVP